MLEDCVPFDNAEEVWFWFCACLQARGEGLRSKSDYNGEIRPCETADIYRIIKRLKSSGYLNGRHLRVMYCWGALHCPPYYDRRAKRSEIRLWCDAMSLLESVFRSKNIIANEGGYYV